MTSRTVAAVPFAFLLFASACRKPEAPAAPLPVGEASATECAAPVVEHPSERVWVARGFDLANVILVHTSEGNVVVDTAMSPARARPIRDALFAAAPKGPVRAVIFTHSHVDHVGGASVFVDDAGPDVQVWASAKLVDGIAKQYGVFQPAEQRRGALQFGDGVSDEELPCSALGRRPDLAAAAATGTRLPNHVVDGSAVLHFGDTTLELVEAPGETDDTIFVEVKEDGAILAGDDFYRAFPNLYTLRGTRPRSAPKWIASLDEMRRRRPKLVVPSHTAPIVGAGEAMRALTDVRDGIAFLYAHVVHGANAGWSRARIVETAALPFSLAQSPYLAERYGRLSWSAAAIYDAELGWFDEDPASLYPPPEDERRATYRRMMGGDGAVLAEVDRDLAAGNTRLALDLLRYVGGDGVGGDVAARRDDLRRRALTTLGRADDNTNGRAWLLASRTDAPASPKPDLDDALLDELPLSLFFDVMKTRVKDGAADGCIALQFPAAPRTLIVIRRGVVEIGDDVPDAPAPIATLTLDEGTWKRLALGKKNGAAALADGSLHVDGDRLGLLTFLARFEK